MTRRLKVYLIAAVAALAVSGLGASLTELGAWYAGLRQPPWKPADAWFGPVWTAIFTLTAWAAARAWLHAPAPRERRAVLLVTSINAALNVGWSLLFFRLRRPDWALAEVVALWLSIAVMAAVFARQDRLAAALLLPYLAWVGFAAVLNAAVVRLNGPFGGAA